MEPLRLFKDQRAETLVSWRAIQSSRQITTGWLNLDGRQGMYGKVPDGRPHLGQGW